MSPFESTVLSGGGVLFVDLDRSSPGYGSVNAALKRTADLAFLFRSERVRQRFAWLG